MFLPHSNAKTVTAHNISDNNNKNKKGHPSDSLQIFQIGNYFSFPNLAVTFTVVFE